MKNLCTIALNSENEPNFIYITYLFSGKGIVSGSHKILKSTGSSKKKGGKDSLSYTIHKISVEKIKLQSISFKG